MLFQAKGTVTKAIPTPNKRYRALVTTGVQDLGSLTPGWSGCLAHDPTALSPHLVYCKAEQNTPRTSLSSWGPGPLQIQGMRKIPRVSGHTVFPAILPGAPTATLLPKRWENLKLRQP
jgi:hypothetical protein